MARALQVKNQYTTGLDKLEFAASQVADMRQELEDLQPKLAQAQVDNAKMMEVINKESKEAAEIEVRVSAFVFEGGSRLLWAEDAHTYTHRSRPLSISLSLCTHTGECEER